jgi:2'-5' RNA ligase
MHFVVELFLDESADRAVRAIWRSLASAGVSSTIDEIGSHPHVSLAMCRELDAARFQPVLERFAAETPPLEVVLASVGVFPTEEGAVFLAPVVSRRLLDLHEGLHGHLSAFGGQSEPYYRPGNWVPHCTVAFGVADDLIPRAVQVCKGAGLPLSGRLVRAALVQYLPARVLYAFDLVGR